MNFSLLVSLAVLFTCSFDASSFFCLFSAMLWCLCLKISLYRMRVSVPVNPSSCWLLALEMANCRPFCRSNFKDTKQSFFTTTSFLIKIGSGSLLLQSAALGSLISQKSCLHLSFNRHVLPFTPVLSSGWSSLYGMHMSPIKLLPCWKIYEYIPTVREQHPRFYYQ